MVTSCGWVKDIIAIKKAMNKKNKIRDVRINPSMEANINLKNSFMV